MAITIINMCQCFIHCTILILTATPGDRDDYYLGFTHGEAEALMGALSSWLRVRSWSVVKAASG